jgi:hypothetical protein
MEKSDKESVGFNSLEGSEFWRHGDRYNTQNTKPSVAEQQMNYSGNYKLAYTSSARPDFEKEFLNPPQDGDGFDDWNESCLHSAENYSSPRKEV